MKEKDGLGLGSPKDTAWRLFEKTGDINYYLLYKNLKDK